MPALYLGCMLANVISLYGVYDIFVGSLVTLVAALFTFAAGKIFRESRHTVGNHIARVGFGGFFPVILNAAIVPVVIVYLAGFADGFETAVAAYGWNFLSLLISQSVWIYALGTPLYLFVTRMRQRNISVFLDGKKKTAEKSPAAGRKKTTEKNPAAGKKKTAKLRYCGRLRAWMKRRARNFLKTSARTGREAW